MSLLQPRSGKGGAATAVVVLVVMLGGTTACGRTQSEVRSGGASAAGVITSTDPAAPLVIPKNKTGLTTEEISYGSSCAMWHLVQSLGLSQQNVQGISNLAAKSRHPGLIAAVDHLVRDAASGVVSPSTTAEMERLCAGVER